eukprot:2755124-Karenia_brevis.AAC.1
MQVMRQLAAQYQPAACDIQLGRADILSYYCCRPSTSWTPDPMTVTMCFIQQQQVATTIGSPRSPATAVFIHHHLHQCLII